MTCNKKALCNDFFSKWKEICLKKQNEIILAWESGSYKQFTDIMLGKYNNGSVLQELAKNPINKINYYCYQEYYSCDAVFYKEKDVISEKEIKELWKPYIGKNTPAAFDQIWLTNVKVHFEHENYIRTSWQEISHFCTTPGELNVLVTYPCDEEEAKTALNCYKSILENSKFAFEVLIIFGYHVKGNKNIDWEGFEYDCKNKLFQKKL